MIRPRHIPTTCLRRQFLSPPTLYAQQIRTKTTKHMYKGGQPKQPKKPSPKLSALKEAKIAIEAEKSAIPPKKPKDPMQGLRAVAEKEKEKEREKIIKPPPPVEEVEVADEGGQPTPPEGSFAGPATPPERVHGGPIPGAPEGASSGSAWKYLMIGAVAVFIGTFWYLMKDNQSKTKDDLETDDDDDDPKYPKTHEKKAASQPKPELVDVKPLQKNVLDMIKIMKEVFGDRCSTEPEDLFEFGGEGIMNIGDGRKPRAIVWPTSTKDVEIILRAAQIYKVPVIPYSGGTSTEGQCVPVTDCITVSMAKMNKVVAFRPKDMDVTVQPGVSWNDLNDLLKPHGLFLPVDPGPHAHIGGMISTSASGTNAVKYGTMKDWVLNLTVVLPGGKVIKTRSRARKSSTGYDLTRLFCGAEGTLGIITEATLKLTHLPEKEIVGAVAFDSNTSAADAVSKALAAGVEPRCIELLDSTCIAAVNQSLKNTPKFPVKTHIFFKLAGQASVVPQQQAVLTSILMQNGGGQLRIATDPKEGERLWEIRKTLAYSLVHAFPGTEVISTDVCVPMSSLPILIEQYKKDQEQINEELADDEEEGRLNSLIMGHVGDGNFHSMIAFEKGNKQLKKLAKTLERKVVANALALGGSCSGEHGVGHHKLEFMPQEYGPNELLLMRSIKSAIDQNNIMNPGALLPTGRWSRPPEAPTIDSESILQSSIMATEELTKDTPKKIKSSTENSGSLLGRSWGTVKRWGWSSGQASSSASDSPSTPSEGAGETKGVWKEQGDGA